MQKIDIGVRQLVDMIKVRLPESGSIYCIASLVQRGFTTKDAHVRSANSKVDY
jgi:hypothetical protein